MPPQIYSPCFVVSVDPDIATTTHIGLPLISFDLLLIFQRVEASTLYSVSYHLWLFTAPTPSYNITRPRLHLWLEQHFHKSDSKPRHTNSCNFRVAQNMYSGQKSCDYQSPSQIPTDSAQKCDMDQMYLSPICWVISIRTREKSFEAQLRVKTVGYFFPHRGVKKNLPVRNRLSDHFNWSYICMIGMLYFCLRLIRSPLCSVSCSFFFLQRNISIYLCERTSANYGRTSKSKVKSKDLHSPLTSSLWGY